MRALPTPITRRSLPLVLLFALCIAFAGGTQAAAAELLPVDTPVEVAIDHYINQRLTQENVEPAPLAGDAAILRRTTLDLVGRVPTLAELDQYLDEPTAEKRHAMVDRLIASPGFIEHEANVLDTFLMHPTGRSIRDYLVRSLNERKTWDVIFQDLMLPDPESEPLKGAEEFLKTRIRDTDQATSDVSVLFFGVNVSCAQCHDHPHVADWSQEVYYGMKSFLDRTFDNGGQLAERDHGLVKYQTTAGDNREASVRFISGTTLEMPEPVERTDEIKKAEKEYFEKFKEEKKQPPSPENSLRRKLVETALAEGENIYLARATVNRIWGRLLGRGLVTPLDQMHSENPASHPELLEWLARDLVDHDFDTRRIVRGIALSEAYARESRRGEGESPAEELFAVGQTRVLSPFQYASSLKLAATKPERFAAETDSQELEKRLEQIASAGRGLAREFEVPMDNFQVSVDEALLMTNSERIQRDLLAGGDKLTDELAKLESDEQRVNHAMRVVLGRSPTEEELTVLVGYLAQRSDRTEAACQQLVWALLTSSEFRFNH